ncbi:hypothetical protein GLOIN_2v1769762 [Rhizophagus clarus]|uniref:RING-type domain-containing protein n=1 Tax=Rhizophagus clarus TaxID=94130 RepID=A0A8H3KWT3_9GLOM|nr:hypothetical protein GLOIN_2v1769762 [Rhizophagus clarus]
MVRDKEISDLGPCSECTNDILTLPLKAFTILSCGHLFHKLCIEKKLMITRPDVYPFPNCGMKVDIIYPVSTTTRRGSQSSQSSGTSALSNWMGEKFNLISPILEDLMEEVEDTSIQEMEKRLFCAKCSEEITLNFLLKDTVFLSCKHVMHYDCIDNPRKKCPTCPAEDSSKKRTNTSTEESSNKKAKKTKSEKKVSGKLKNLIEELSSETSQDSVVTEEGTGDFFDLYNSIINMEGQEEIAKRDVIKSYFNFGKALDDCFNYYKKDNPKRTAQALVNKKVQEQLPNVSDEAIRKKKEWALKIYDIFKNKLLESKEQVKKLRCKIKSISSRKNTPERGNSPDQYNSDDNMATIIELTNAIDGFVNNPTMARAIMADQAYLEGHMTVLENANAGDFDNAVKCNILKSMIGGKYAPVSANNGLVAGNLAINTPDTLRAWMRAIQDALAQQKTENQTLIKKITELESQMAKQTHIPTPQTVEPIEPEEMDHDYPVKLFQRPHPQRSNISTRIDRVEEGINETRDAVNQLTNQFQKLNIRKCDTCGETGHSKSSCPKQIARSNFNQGYFKPLTPINFQNTPSDSDNDGDGYDEENNR